MVQVNHHHLVANVDDAGHEAIAFLVLQGDNGIDEDSLAIEAAVDGEEVAVQFQHTFLIVKAVTLFCGQRKVEVAASLQFHQFLLEGFKGYAEATEEYERLVFRGSFYQMAAGFINGIEVIGHCHVLVFVLFHVL